MMPGRVNAGLRHSGLLQSHDERIFIYLFIYLFIFFTNSLLRDAGKGLKNGPVLTPLLSSSTPIKHPPPQTQFHLQLYQDVLLLAKKQVYKLIFHHQKFVYRLNNNIKPKKAKSFLDIVVKNDANGISNKLDKYIHFAS